MGVKRKPPLVLCQGWCLPSPPFPPSTYSLGYSQSILIPRCHRNVSRSSVHQTYSASVYVWRIYRYYFLFEFQRSLFSRHVKTQGMFNTGLDYRKLWSQAKVKIILKAISCNYFWEYGIKYLFQNKFEKNCNCLIKRKLNIHFNKIFIKI